MSDNQNTQEPSQVTTQEPSQVPTQDNPDKTKTNQGNNNVKGKAKTKKEPSSKKPKRRYTGVGVLIVTNFLDKPYIVLGMEKGKSKKYYNKIIKYLDGKKKRNANTSTTADNVTNTISTPDDIIEDANSELLVNNDNNHNENRENNTDQERQDEKLNRHTFLYEEFGGGIQNNNLTQEENACFELNEETCNLINFTNPFILNKGINTFFDIPYLKDRIYRLYVVFIPDFTQVIHLFYKNLQVLKSAPSSYYKFRNYCEMTDMSIIELDHIYKYKGNLDNYVCFNAEENLYNQIIHDKGKKNYRGILRCPDNVFLSARLVEFLNMNFIYDKIIKGYVYHNGDIDHKLNKDLNNKFSGTVKHYKPHMIMGLDFCNYIYYQGMYAVKHNFTDSYINLTKPRKTNKQNAKYSFLGHTWCVDGY
jgi:hypothetical protein